jgi:hypothetical protein
VGAGPCVIYKHGRTDLLQVQKPKYSTLSLDERLHEI